jgi:hypothetical protein
VDAGEAGGQALVDALAHGAVELLVRWPRHDRLQQRLRGVDQETRRLAALVAHDDAAGRIGRAAIDADRGQRGRVRPRRVPVDAYQRHRMLGRRRVERGLGGEGAAGPEVLIPVAAGDPLAGGPHRRALADAPGDLVLGRHPAYVEAQPAARQVHEVAVRVHQSRQHRAPAEVVHGLAGVGIDVGPPPDEGHAPVAHDQRVGDRAGGVERVDARVGQEHTVSSALRRPGVLDPGVGSAR